MYNLLVTPHTTHSVGQELYHCLLSMASTSVLLQPNETQCYHNLLCKAYHQLSIIHSIGMRRGNNRKLAQQKKLIR